MSDSVWFTMSNDLLCTADMDGYFTLVNDEWTRALGWTRDELLARPFHDLVHPHDVATTVAAAESLQDAGVEVVQFENRYRTRSGTWRWLLWSAQSDGTLIYAVAKDITDRKHVEQSTQAEVERLRAMARTDALTGLPNRRAWDEEIRRELSRARRYAGSFSLALLDLDRFKQFNDTHGHPAGDTLLQEVAIAWRLALRASDFLARYGGEEFGLVLPDTPLPDALNAIERLQGAMPHGQTVSAGVVTWRGEDVEMLVARADHALYRAKGAGRDCIVPA